VVNRCNASEPNWYINRNDQSNAPIDLRQLNIFKGMVYRALGIGMLSGFGLFLARYQPHEGGMCFCKRTWNRSSFRTGIKGEPQVCLYSSARFSGVFDFWKQSTCIYFWKYWGIRYWVSEVWVLGFRGTGISGHQVSRYPLSIQSFPHLPIWCLNLGVRYYRVVQKSISWVW